jgi:hypothetical protein
MDDKDIMDACLHCAIMSLIAYRQKHGLDETPDDVILRLTELTADICASFQGDRRNELLVLGAFCNLVFSKDVKNYKWKGDNDAGPGTENTKRH